MFAFEVALPLDLADDLETASVASESASEVEAASESPPLSLPSQPAAQTVAESAVHQHPSWMTRVYMLDAKYVVGKYKDKDMLMGNNSEICRPKRGLIEKKNTANILSDFVDFLSF